MKYFARPGQFLKDHLIGTAELAKKFASAFDAGEWGYITGLLHDLGKYSEEFQDKIKALDPDAHIEQKNQKVDHSTAGAQELFKKYKDPGKIIAYAIAGHHAGIPDGKSAYQSCLMERLKKKIPEYLQYKEEVRFPEFSGNLKIKLDQANFGYSVQFFTRMLFSCLVDGDFLDTEKAVNPEQSKHREEFPTLTDLHRELFSYLEKLNTSTKDIPINKIRKDIQECCIKAAEWNPGFFSLTVPTGGGKTLSSLAFALKHALKYGKKRIIYIIPYTSIIEQNADVFRKALGKFEYGVLEHHSNFEPSEENYKSRLASENWDAPLIVTTNVQFFESLYGDRSSVCRKLHNIAESVIILDEAQMLPVEKLKPCLESIKELVLNYNTSIVLCTATQPALNKREEFQEGLENVREIIPDTHKLHDFLKRVEVRVISPENDEDLSKEIQKNPQVLCVVNTRKHARELYELIGREDGNFHLSALMCPTHRSEKIKIIKERLKSKHPCRVISTQLIEAGVDIDFPVVYRSITGIDSIAQSAGRCNREGRLEKGQVFVFKTKQPPGIFRQTAQAGEESLRNHEGDPLSLESVEDYFKNYYWLKHDQMDSLGILPSINADAARGNFPFEEIAKKFRIIKDGTIPLIIPYNQTAVELIRSLRFSEHSGSIARKLQRFSINIYPNIRFELNRVIEVINDQYHVLINPDLYKDDLGLCSENPSFYEAESLIS